ncbi:MAG TPA: hypothetical protein VEJ20_10155, partial [Candidatus Eremiobacteraceae bacterium]|nr:hypothetical protein [Candidatus Eremiobacteraceae bacterium]
ATLPPYGVHWRAGERDLLLVSVGTGLVELSNLGLKPGEMNVLYNVQSLPAALIRGATIEQDVLCRVFGKLQSGDEIDSEIGSLAGLRAPLEEKLFTYARYNVDLSRRGLDELGLQDVDEKGVQRLDSVDYFDALRRIGVAAAERLVTPGDYADFLFPGGAVTAPAAVS